MFSYANNQLCIQNDKKFFLSELKIDRPAYVYDLSGLLKRYDFINKSFQNQASIHFALKSNNNPVVLRHLAQKGCGADVVSGGEFKRALECGFNGNKIVFSGVGKTKKEIEFALKNNVMQINIESRPELERVIEIARQTSQSTPVRVALRANPDVNPDTHPNIKTGFRDNKFGLDFTEVQALLPLLIENKKYVELVGLTLHIGSQIREPAPFFEAIRKTIDLFRFVRAEGFDLKTFDIGGGFGIDYGFPKDFSEEEHAYSDYAKKIVQDLTSESVQILTEPGRFLVGHFGLLLGEIQYIKKTPFKNFVILNTGMNHLMRPALYEAYHHIAPLKLDLATDSSFDEFDIVGPICESTDVLGFSRKLPTSIREGDWLAIFDAGAYGAVLANDYNLHERPLEIVVFEERIL